jgi:glycosyltransferase involved in cell wall biosynthesis
MKKPITIVYTSTQFNKVVSGPGRFVEYLRQFKSEKISIIFISDQIEQSKENLVSATRIPFLEKFPFYWVLRYWFFARALKKLNKQTKIDAVLCSTAFEALFIKKRGFPVYVMINDYKYALANFNELRQSASFFRAAIRKLYFRLEKSLVHWSDFMVANSKYNQKLIEQAYNMPASKSKLLYKTVDLHYFNFKPKEIRPPQHLLFIKNDFRIGGLPVIFKALGQLTFNKELTFVVAGISANDKPIVEQLAKEAGYFGKLRIEGLVNRDRVKALHNEAQLFITMSHREALGVSCLEALACGTPVIATRVGGLPEVLDDGNAGFLVEANSDLELKNLLESLWQNPSPMKEKIENGRTHAAKFDVSHLEENLLSLFQPA